MCLTESEDSLDDLAHMPACHPIVIFCAAVLLFSPDFLEVLVQEHLPSAFELRLFMVEGKLAHRYCARYEVLCCANFVLLHGMLDLSISLSFSLPLGTSVFVPASIDLSLSLPLAFLLPSVFLFLNPYTLFTLRLC